MVYMWIKEAGLANFSEAVSVWKFSICKHPEGKKNPCWEFSAHTINIHTGTRREDLAISLWVWAWGLDMAVLMTTHIHLGPHTLRASSTPCVLREVGLSKMETLLTDRRIENIRLYVNVACKPASVCVCVCVFFLNLSLIKCDS